MLVRAAAALAGLLVVRGGLASLIAAAAALVALAACSDDSGGSFTTDRFATELGDVYCGTAFTCEASFPSDLGTTHDQAFGVDANACKGRMVDGAQLDASIAAGRINFNPTAASACIAEVAALDCAAFWAALAGDDFPIECRMATVGVVAAGGACALNVDCVSRRCSSGGICNESD